MPLSSTEKRSPQYLLEGYGPAFSMPVVCGREPDNAPRFDWLARMRQDNCSSATGSEKPLKTNAVRRGIARFTGLADVPHTVGRKVPSDHLKIFGLPVGEQDAPTEQPTSLKDGVIGGLGRNDGIGNEAVSFLVSPENTLVPHSALNHLYNVASGAEQADPETMREIFSRQASIGDGFQERIYDIAVTVLQHDGKIGIGISDPVQVPHLWIQAFANAGGVGSDLTMAKVAKRKFADIENDADWHALIDKGFDGKEISPQPRSFYLEQSVERAMSARFPQSDPAEA